MKLRALIKKLQEKPQQDEEVHFLVMLKKDTEIVCMDLSGPHTTGIIKVLGTKPTKES